MTNLKPNSNASAPRKNHAHPLALAFIVSLFTSMLVGGSFGLLLASAVLLKPQGQLIQKIFGQKPAEQLTEQNPATDGSLPASNVSESTTVASVVEKTDPAVVSIIISKDVPIIERYYENPFEDLLGPFGIQIPRERQNGTEKQEIGGGSGFIITADGFIVTNRHVVSDDAAEYTVLTNDEKRYTAQVMDRDPNNDLAVLKIDPASNGQEKLPFLELGDSQNLKVGQTVIAIGNSLGEFRNTVSKGIVSGLKRNITASTIYGSQSETLSELIQTDAAINQGNSGGPLLNLKGEVIGVNVAMASGAENIGFAIPINTIRSSIEAIKTQGEIVRSFLGIRYILNSQTVAQKNRLPYDYGALIQRGEAIDDLAVIPGSPADKAGLRENDLILEIDGQQVNEENNPATVVAQKQPGDTITVKVWSRGEEKNMEITLEKR